MAIHNLFDKGRKREVRDAIASGRGIPARRQALPAIARELPEPEREQAPAPSWNIPPQVIQPAPAQPVQPPLMPVPPQPPQFAIPIPPPRQQPVAKRINVPAVPSPHTASVFERLLMEAVQKGDERGAEDCIRKGADPNLPVNGMMPIHKASSLGHSGMIRLLIRKGADANAQDDSGRTALHWAVKSKQPEALRALAACHPDFEKPDIKGMTPLHKAISMDDEYLAELVLKYGANVDTPTRPGLLTPLMLAIGLAHRSRSLSLVSRVLENRPGLDRRDINGKTALVHAIDSGNAKIVRKLLKARADITAVDSEGIPVLHYVRENGTFLMRMSFLWHRMCE